MSPGLLPMHGLDPRDWQTVTLALGVECLLECLSVTAVMDYGNMGVYQHCSHLYRWMDCVSREIDASDCSHCHECNDW